MKKPLLAILVRALMVLSVLSVTACGSDGPEAGLVRDTGSGDDDGDDSDGGGDSGGDTTVALSLLQGQVMAAGGGAVAGVEVSLSGVNASGEEVISLSTETDEFGAYQVSVPELGDKVVARIYASFEKDGFSAKETYADASSSVLDINATLAVAYTASIKREDLESLAVASDGVPSLHIALVSSGSGLKRVVIGDVLPADGEVADVAVNIPVANIDPDAEVINVSIASFDSGDEEALESFPGDFTAQGEVDQGSTGANMDRDDTSEEASDLISTTFMDVSLTDQNGDALQSNSRDATASATGSTYIRKYASPSTYQRIYADVDPSVAGIQFPFFVKRSGYYSSWQYVGNGTIVDSAGVAIGPNHPTIPVTIAADGSVNLTTLTGNPVLYFNIEINSWSEWVRYINVDYYTANLSRAQQPVDMCFTGTAEYGGGAAYNGDLYVRTPDYGYALVPVRDGKIAFNRTVSPVYGDPLQKSVWASNYSYMYGRNLRNPITYTWSYYNWSWNGFYWTVVPATYTYTYYPTEVTYADALFSEQSQLVSKADGCNEVRVVFTNPAKCVVQGHIYDQDGTTPLAKEPVTLKAGGSRLSVVTDSNGYYRTSAWCDASYDASAIAKTSSFNLSTGNSPYTLDFVDDNRPPILGVFKEKRRKLYTSQSTYISWYSSDPEGDAVTVTLGDCASDDNTCSVVRSSSEDKATLTFASAGTYSIDVTASDERNDVTRSMEFVVVDPDVNLAPAISGFVVNGKFVANGGVVQAVDGADLTVGIRASDVNGDSLTYEWTDEDGNASGCGSDSACVLSLASTGEYTMAVAVSDVRSSADSLTSHASFSLNVVSDAAPGATLDMSASYYSAQDGVNIEPVKAVLTAYDDLTANADLDIVWQLLDSNDQDITSRIRSYFFNDYNISIPPGAFGTGTYRLLATVTDVSATGDSGLSTQVSTTFSIVADVPPTIEITAPSTTLYGTASGGSTQSLTLTAVYSDNEGVRSFNWNVPSGLSATISGDSVTIAASSLKPGSYTVGATVVDSAGYSVRANRVITVETDQPPVISSLTVTPESLLANTAGYNSEAVQASVTASDDHGDVTVVGWTVSPSVPFTASGNSLSIAAGAAATGEYQVTVQVQDNRGQTTTRSASFDVIERDGNVEVIIE